VDLRFKSMLGTFNVDEAQGIVECFVAAVGNKDSVGDIVIPGAFTTSFDAASPASSGATTGTSPSARSSPSTRLPPTTPASPPR